jgi:UDP-N-acetylmuramoylalanine--D-glutamate ligase
MQVDTMVRDALAGKRVVIIGLARQGKALVRFAVERGAYVIVSDQQPAEALAPALAELSGLTFEVVAGGHPMSLLEGADQLLISGGVPNDLPLVQAARRRGIPVSNDSLEFMKRSPALVMGITGSAGKTTTTALTGHMLQQAGIRTWVGGNIGRPLISELDRMESTDIAVQELSSFQLELWDRSPPVAAVLNLTPNHLDRHGNMDAYRDAKANILRHQRPANTAVLSADDPGALSLRGLCRSRLRLFSSRQRVDDGAHVEGASIWLTDETSRVEICSVEDVPLRGAHNVLNVLASVVLADSVGVQVEAMRQAIRTFQGVEHRLEAVGQVEGVLYVNDSIATAPERALAAIDAFEEPLILLAGGRDKGMVWSEWARRVSQRVRVAILFGELAPALAAQLEEAVSEARRSGARVMLVETLDEAVRSAARVARPGDVVLLAPGGTSFDTYRDFEERGRAFRDLVQDLAHGLDGSTNWGPGKKVNV